MRNSSAVWKRSPGDFASARFRTRAHHSGRSGWNCVIGVGGSLTCFCTIAIAVSALERQLPGEQSVEHDANRVEIGSAVDLAAEDLLGRHVRGRAHHVAALREVLGAQHARDPEVHDLDDPHLGDHQVGRLQVAVHDAGAVRVRERVEDLHRRGAQPAAAASAPRRSDELVHASRRARTPSPSADRRRPGRARRASRCPGDSAARG